MQRIKALAYSSAGQTTAEYALVLVVAAIVVGVFAAFVKSGALDDFFAAIIDKLVTRAGG